MGKKVTHQKVTQRKKFHSQLIQQKPLLLETKKFQFLKKFLLKTKKMKFT